MRLIGGDEVRQERILLVDRRRGRRLVLSWFSGYGLSSVPRRLTAERLRRPAAWGVERWWPFAGHWPTG